LSSIAGGFIGYSNKAVLCVWVVIINLTNRAD
jgi:hypothetical protein